MALSIGTTLPGGYRNSLGGPVDPFYAQADGTPWPSIAAACAAVPNAFRRSRTVIVAGIGEMQWLVGDISNAGLLPKAGAVAFAGAAVVRSLTTKSLVMELPPAIAALGIDKIFCELIPRIGPPPSSYDTTLTSTDNQADGIVAGFASTQTLQTNVIANAAGGVLTLRVLDNSDSGSPSDFDYRSDYKGTYFKFNKKDGSFHEGLWPSKNQTISV